VTFNPGHSVLQATITLDHTGQAHGKKDS
jgi:hypothetical protein